MVLLAVIIVLYVPSVRHAVLNKGVEIANEKMDYDISLDRIYLSPFHHSPWVFYRAYKGEADLPVEVQIDSLFVGHRGQDTLLYTRALRIRARLLTSSCENGLASGISFLSIPIVVDTLRLENTTFHSDSLIKTVGVDVVVDHLALSSPNLSIAEGQYPLHGLRIYGADVGIDLRSQPASNAPKTQNQSAPLRLAFDIPDGELRRIHYGMTPLGMDIRTRHLSTSAMVDVGANCYDARHLNVGGFSLELKQLYLPVDTVYGSACADIARHLITSDGLHARSDEIGARADITATTMDIASLRVDVVGDAQFRGSKAQLRGFYDIRNEAYNATVHIERVNLSPFLKDSTRIVLAGDLQAKGRGISPKRPLRSYVHLDLDEAIYGALDFSHTSFEGATDSVTSLALRMPGLKADVRAPMPLFRFIDGLLPMVATLRDSAVLHALTSLEDLTVLDTIRRMIPAFGADIALRKGSPIQTFIDRTGLGFDEVLLSLQSDSLRTAMHLAPLALDMPASLAIPTIHTALDMAMTEGETTLSLEADTRLTDGMMTFDGLCTDVGLRMDMKRDGRLLFGKGKLVLDSLAYTNNDLGNHTIDLQLAPSNRYKNALRADVQLDDIPLEMMKSFVNLPDITIEGALRAMASVEGLPRKADISAEVQPVGVAAQYKPYEIGIRLGETPIVMKHNHIDLNGLPIYAADSTFLSLSGGLDLDSMKIDISLSADSFAPIKLPQGGPLPVYGELATDIQGSVSGPLNNMVADVAVTLLPVTDITYPIDKKNLAQVKPHGTVHVRYGTSDGKLDLGGRIHVDDGLVRYSPKAYPVLPFKVDSGSHIAFNGPIGKTYLDVSASQNVKADVDSKAGGARRVSFNTGVRLQGEVDSIGIRSIGFFLEAPGDEPVSRELAAADEDTREGLAAMLLTTGMYLGQTNDAAQREGYALSSIVNSRINAAIANSKMGKFMEVDFSSGKTNDMNITLSKSFLKDKLRITVGSTISDDPEVNETKGLLSSVSADYKLTKSGNVSLRLYSRKDNNNVLEGELYKAGLAVRASKDWRRQETYRGDTIIRTHGLTADVGLAYRSNNSIGPDLNLKYALKNVLGKGETFSVKGNGAYYWALRNRYPGDPKKTDTYKLGVNAALVFPYLHWAGDKNPDGTTRYSMGYQYENIAGGYGIHKLSGSFTYFFHSERNPYITHAFTPFSLSVVFMKAESADLYDKAADYPQLIKVLASDEFVPSISYNFIYNNYRSQRPVNTMLDLGVKESGNLLNALYCALGRGWDEKEKNLGKTTFNQFIKLSMELRNKFNFTDKVSLATRLFAGMNIPLGNSLFAPLSEAFYAGGPNGMRAATPYAYGPGNFFSAKYNQNFFHAGDLKLEANVELRFPIVWKLYGAAFLDAGNVWNWYSTVDLLKEAGFEDYVTRLELPEELHDGIYNNPDFAKQIALGTGLGLRLDLEGLVIRLDIGVAIHAPFQTFKYDKDGKPDPNQPIRSYYNIPSAYDALRINFGIGYPF